MKVRCVWEHNGDDSLLYAEDFIGAFTRGSSLAEAVLKMPEEIRRFRLWTGDAPIDEPEIEIVQQKCSDLQIRDADSDVLFISEEAPLSEEEYRYFKSVAMKSAEDFQTLYSAFPDKNRSDKAKRRTFYGEVPRTAEEMYEHTKNVNVYYFSEIGVDADNEGTIVSCRARGFEALEAVPNFLSLAVVSGSYDEKWSVRKVFRRFIWHDRLHAKAMYKMGVSAFGAEVIPDVFGFTR
ncbi:MAG: hypothetical protein IKZ82_06745 [Clostridia bacterium]|nr:hypothetical protein [Clostridia bacterium]